MEVFYKIWKNSNEIQLRNKYGPEQSKNEIIHPSRSACYMYSFT